MVVQVMRPSRGPNPLDDILKGVSVAQSLFGISSNIGKLEALHRAQDEEQMAKGREMAKQDRLAQGKFFPTEQLILEEKGFQFVEPGTKGARKVSIMMPEKEISRGLLTPSQVKEMAAAKERHTRRTIAKTSLEEKRAQKLADQEKAQRRRDEAAFQRAASQVAGLGRGSARFAMLINRNRQSRNVLRIIELMEKGEVAKSRQMAQELATGMASLLASGSAAAQTQIEHLVPHSLQGRTADIVQYLSGKPQDFLTDAFLEQFKHQLEAEKHFFKGEMDRVHGVIGLSIAPVLDRNPDLEDKLLEAISFIAKQGEAGAGHVAGAEITPGPSITPQQALEELKRRGVITQEAAPAPSPGP